LKKGEILRKRPGMRSKPTDLRTFKIFGFLGVAVNLLKSDVWQNEEKRFFANALFMKKRLSICENANC